MIVIMVLAAIACFIIAYACYKSLEKEAAKRGVHVSRLINSSVTIDTNATTNRKQTETIAKSK